MSKTYQDKSGNKFTLNCLKDNEQGKEKFYVYALKDGTQDDIMGVCIFSFAVSHADGEPYCFIEGVQVEEKYARLGIGSTLLKAVESFATKKGADHLDAKKPEHNVMWSNFYSKNGFKDDGYVAFKLIGNKDVSSDSNVSSMTM